MQPEKNILPCPVWLSGLGVVPRAERSPVRPQATARAGVLSPVPGQGEHERPPVAVPLLLGCFSPSPSSSLVRSYETVSVRVAHLEFLGRKPGTSEVFLCISVNGLSERASCLSSALHCSRVSFHTYLPGRKSFFFHCFQISVHSLDASAVSQLSYFAFHLIFVGFFFLMALHFFWEQHPHERPASP